MKSHGGDKRLLRVILYDMQKGSTFEKRVHIDIFMHYKRVFTISLFSDWDMFERASAKYIVNTKPKEVFSTKMWSHL